MTVLPSILRRAAPVAALVAVPAAAAPFQMDFITHNQRLIAAPPAAIWPHIVSLDWKRGPKFVTIAGAPDRMGARFEAREGRTLGFTAENVEIVPQRVRTFRMNEPGGALIGYATLTLIPQGRATLVRYDVYGSIAMPEEIGRLPAAKQAAIKADYLAQNSRRFDAEFAVLKARSEAATAASRKEDGQ